MKLLLSLILIIAFAGSLINCKSIKTDTGCVGAISSLSGYHSNFKAVSFNGAYQNGNQESQSSFYESGYLSVDFKNQQLMFDFTADFDTQQYSGQSFVFAQNQTQYLIVNDECVSLPFKGVFPSSVGLVKVGDSSLGSIDAELLEPQTQTPYSTIQLLVDSKMCSPLSLEATNTDPSTPGYTLLNFYNYVSSVLPSDFILPSQCQSSQKIHKSHNNIYKFIKSHKQILNHLL